MRRNSEREEDVLRYIRAFIPLHGYAPTFQEIANGTGYAKSTCYWAVLALAADGKIHRERGRARSITLPERRAP